MAALRAYRYPVEQAERQCKAQQARLAAAARIIEQTAAPRATPRRSFVPRIAGALGLF